VNQCIEQAGIRHVLTSRRFMEKMDFQLDAEIVYLEDFKPCPR
jgi:acyl-[acyl-carrier-protein]-phospholipid O-acyltransferase / long-chain-fatty-acid--[acyl-carrier-protein] ligase